MTVYEIRVKGHLDGHWSEWFDGLTIANVEDGIAVLSGEKWRWRCSHLALPHVAETGNWRGDTKVMH